MKANLMPIFAVFLFILACDSNQTTEQIDEVGSGYFTAVVLGEDFDCQGFYDIQILDSTIVKRFPNSSGDVFVALGLPQSLEITGINMKIKFREVNDEDKLPVCTLMGPKYEQIIILSAIKIE